MFSGLADVIPINHFCYQSLVLVQSEFMISDSQVLKVNLVYKVVVEFFRLLCKCLLLSVLDLLVCKPALSAVHDSGLRYGV